MTDTRYKIVFDGQLLPGVELETAKDNLASLFKTQRAAVEKLFSGRPVALKRELNDADAQKYLSALQNAGLNARIETDAMFNLALVEDGRSDSTLASQQMTCPKCGHVQATSPECNACGIIIEKFVAAQSITLSKQGEQNTSYSNSSPYTPPRSQLDHGGPEFCELKLWGIEGRLGRVRYLGWSVALMLVLSLGAAVCFGIGMLVMPIGILLGAALYIALIVISIQIGVKRLHDLDWSGWLLLINLIPVVSFVFALIMVFMPGTKGRNRFGPPPPPNSAGVVVLAWLMLIFPVLGGIGAAVAIPAYNQYVMRAKAVQHQQAQQQSAPASADDSDDDSDTDSE